MPKRKTRTVTEKRWGVIDGGGGLRTQLHIVESDALEIAAKDTRIFRALGPHRVIPVTLTYEVPHAD